MSSYSSSTPTIAVPTIAQQLRTQCSLLLEREGAWVSSVEFARATRLNLSADVSSLRLSEALGRLSSMPTMHHLTRAAAGDLLRRAETTLADAFAAERAGDTAKARRLAAAGERHLKNGIAATHQRLAVDDRSVTSAVAFGSLRRLGFTVKQASGTHTTGLWALRGHEVVAVVVHDGGAVEMDHAGFAGNACEAVSAAFAREMQRDGITLNLARVEFHGDAGGGTLVQRAGKCGGGPEGLVIQQELGLPVAETAPEAPVPQAQRRAVGQ
jgi:hypothetical protein